MNTPTGFKQRLGAELAAMEQARAEQSATAEQTSASAVPARRWHPSRRLVISVAGVAAAGIAVAALPALGSHPAAEASAYSLTQEKDGSYLIDIFTPKGLPYAVKELRKRGVNAVLKTALPESTCHVANPPIPWPGQSSTVFPLDAKHGDATDLKVNPKGAPKDQSAVTVVATKSNYYAGLKVNPRAVPKGQTVVVVSMPEKLPKGGFSWILASVYKKVPSCFRYEISSDKNGSHGEGIYAGTLS